MQIIVSRTAGLMFWFMAGFAFLPAQWATSALVQEAEAPAALEVPIPQVPAPAGGLA
jgi:hypothetical protein